MIDLAAEADGTTLAIRPIAPDDLRYVASSWKESHKDAPDVERLPWPVYKLTTCKQIDALLESRTVRTLAAYAGDGRIIGWIAYTPGKAISTVHWTYTRHKLGEEKCRRRGVMTMLLEAAELGQRFAYTFRGPRRNNGARRGGRGPSLDLELVTQLRDRGVTAVFVPLQEWLQ